PGIQNRLSLPDVSASPGLAKVQLELRSPRRLLCCSRTIQSRSLALGRHGPSASSPSSSRITWCEPPPERPISVAHAQLIPRLADSLRASWAFMTLAVQRGDAYSFPRFGARGHLGAHRRAAAAQDARAHGGNDHPEQDALARMSFAGRAFKFKLLW
ncbi:unnamed protein product, partial [Effrenium voratum]